MFLFKFALTCGIVAMWAYRLHMLNVPLKYMLPILAGLTYSLPSEGRVSNAVFIVTLIAYLIVLVVYNRKRRDGDNDKDDDKKEGTAEGGNQLTDIVRNAFRREAQQAT